MNRNTSIDIAKGIGILLVVWGHSSKIFFGEIYSFHMPLFFFISGLLFRNTDALNELVVHKTRSLLIPYGLFLTISILYYGIILKVSGRLDVTYWSVLTDYLPLDSEIINTPLWFLWSLFLMTVIYSFLSKWIVSKFLLTLVVFLCCLITFLMDNNGVVLPLFLGRALKEMIFFHLGCLFRKSRYGDLKMEITQLLMYLLISIFAFILFYSYIHPIFYQFALNIIPYLLCALSGIMTVGTFAVIVNRLAPKKIVLFLSYFGRTSLTILGLHLLFLEIARPIVKRVDFGMAILNDSAVFIIILSISILIGESLRLIDRKFNLRIL